MRVFDSIDASTLERRELHLWLLAISLILILATGLALLMYPAIFSTPMVLTGPAMRRLFFGFCTLAILVAGYLLDRQLTVRQLRRRLQEEQQHMQQVRHEASAQLLESLPGFSHFQDRMAMEFRRASSTQQALSLLVVQLAAARGLTDPGEVATAFGDAAKALLQTLRREDSVYLFGPGLFGILLPAVQTKDAYLVSERLGERVRAASGASERFSFDVRVINYPEHVAAAREMEKAVASAFPERQPAPPAA